MKGEKLIGITTILCIWELFVRFHFIDPFFFPGPIAIMIAFFQMLPHELGKDILYTLTRVLTAYSIAVMIGIPIGLLLGKSATVYRSMEPIIDFLRSIPATAIFPLFMLIFGIGDASKIAVAIFGAAIIIMFNTAYGVVHSKKVRTLAAQLMGASSWKIFSSITFWESLPQTFAGLRSSISLSVILIIFTEMFVGTNIGIGRRIVDSQVVFNIPDLFAAILAAGLLGYILNKILIVLEKRLIHWTGK